MKLSVFLCVTMLTQASAASYGQRISIHVKNAPLVEVLDQITQQSQFSFLYNSAMMKAANPVSLSVDNEELTAVLNDCFKSQPLAYTLNGQTIIIKNLEKPESKEDKRAEIVITGVVTDDKGEPLPAVNIVLKGTTLGTISDKNGVYSIRLPDDNGILVFSLIAFGTREIPVKGQKVLNVTLSDKISALDQVVVVGYGVQKKSDVTGSIVSVKGAETINEPARDVASLLQARAAGVEVVKNSGDPSGSTSIYIRGASSLNNPGPLYVVDGVPQGNTGNNFDTQDVQSVEVLKDASASSIYGAAAAGGVILVTTKRGAKNAKPVMSFNAYAGVTKPILRKLLNRDQYIQAKEDVGQSILTAGENAASLPNTDWVHALYQNGVLQNYDLSLAGGNGNSNFYVSANLSDQKGNVIQNMFRRYSFRINSDHNVGKLLTIGESLQIWDSQTRPTVGGGAFPYRSRPDMLVYDSTNVTGGGWGKEPTGFAGTNFVGQELTSQFHNESSAVEGNVYATLHIIKGLDLKGVFGYENQSDFLSQYIAAYNFGNVQNLDPTLTKSGNNTKNLSSTLTLNYNRTFGKHSIQALAGFEQRVTKGSTLTGQADSLALANTQNFFVTSSTNQYATGGVSQLLIKSYFGRINYSYNQRYIAEISVRRDGDFYRFGPANQFGTFPSASIAWRLGEESFVKDNLHFISDLKLRASYGTVGNNNIASYLFLPEYTLTNAYTFGNTGNKSLAFGINGLANQDIKWENTRETNIGLDLAMLRGSITFSADYYNKLTDGILYNVTLPPSAGIVNAFTTNIGKIQNRGVEFAASYQNSAGDFHYSVSANAAYNQNKILSLGGTANNPVTAGSNDISGGTISRSAAGHALGQFYGLRATGIYQTAAAAAAGPTINGVKPQVGDLIFKDLDNSGAIDDNDQTYIGNPNPKIIYGITINLRYKWLDLAALFQGVHGIDLYNARQPYNQYLYTDGNTTTDIFKTSFFGNNGLTNQPRVVSKDASGNISVDPYGNYNRVSSWWVESGSFLKLQNLQIGFNIPPNWIAKVKARLFVMGSNLFTLTKYSGPDPQVQATDVKARGIDYPTDYPQNRLYSIGLNCTF